MSDSPKQSFDLLSKIADILNLKTLPNRDRKDLFILILSFITIVGFYKLKLITPAEGRIISFFYTALLIVRGIQFTFGRKKKG